MKFILLSDLHLSWENSMARMDDLQKVQFEKLRFVLDWSKENGDVPILQAGDFFDSPRGYYILSKVVSVLNGYETFDKDLIHCVYGQHDTYLYSDATRNSTNLGILNEVDLVHVLGVSFFGENNNVIVMGKSYGQEDNKSEWSYIESPDVKVETKILVIHAPITNAPLWKGHDITHADKFLEEHKEFDLILCGDIHKSFIIERKGRFIVNCGPMLRREATEYNFVHAPHFILYDTEEKSVQQIVIPHEPAEKVLSRDHIEQKEQTEVMLEDFIKMVKETTPGLEAKNSVSFTDSLWAFIKENEIEQEVVDILSKVMKKEK
ncbi:hypothetical protein LCGC14_2636050 [marine sediment metagenome]|uniref:Calcineurin-like phosphoesterase domain-containing protein n=1 Tax=marine sediment metagenome TaxID=412755 RepID=A0A0F9ALE7_9ZZZZ